MTTNTVLKVLEIALPTIVKSEKLDEGKSHLVSSNDIPHEFFGLPAIDQVAVINAVADGLISLLSDAGKEGRVGITSLLEPFYVSIGVRIRYTPNLSVELSLNFPREWQAMPLKEKDSILGSIIYLFKITAVSIFERNQAHSSEGNNE